MRRQTALFVYLLAFYVLLQFAWWAYHIIDLTSLLNDHPAYIRKRTWMILGEGAVFFSIVIFAIVQIRKSIMKDIELSRQQKNFLLAVTHELKTPIASVKLYLQTLKRHQLDDEKRNEIATNALTENERLQQIIDNILSVSQLENRTFQLHKEQINIQQAINTALNAARMQNACEIETSCPKNLNFKLDKNAFHSVLSNLLDNSLKYAGDFPRIAVHCSGNDKQLTVVFEDNGPGVPAEKLDVIFQRFARLGHEETRSSKGVGLGLYIVKELVRAMNGEIKAENISSGGLRFTLIFKAL
jgi:two-component system, OmpR family, phosphate regulon sensor histidine kinase PhoR